MLLIAAIIPPPPQEGFVFGLVGWYVCHFVCLSNYLTSSEQIYMKLSPEVCFGRRSNQLNLGDGLDYTIRIHDPDNDQDHMDCW